LLKITYNIIFCVYYIYMACFNGNIDVYTIKTEAVKPVIGYPCFDGDGTATYLKKEAKSRLNSEILSPDYDFESSGGICQAVASSNVTYKIDEYAELSVGESTKAKSYYKYYSNLNQEIVSDCTNPDLGNPAGCGIQCSCCGCCPEGGATEYKSYKNKDICETSVTSSEGTPNGCAGGSAWKNEGCPSELCFGADEGDLVSTSCDEYNISRSYSSEQDGVTTHVDGTANIRLSSPLTNEKALGIAKQISAKKKNIYNTNEPQNSLGTRCGLGRVDDCWGLDGLGSIQNNTIIAQNFGVLLVAPDLKEGEKIEAKIFVYTPDGQRSPCCDPSYNGIIVHEQEFSINLGSPIYKDGHGVKLFFDNGNWTNGESSLRYCIV